MCHIDHVLDIAVVDDLDIAALSHKFCGPDTDLDDAAAVFINLHDITHLIFAFEHDGNAGDHVSHQVFHTKGQCKRNQTERSDDSPCVKAQICRRIIEKDHDQDIPGQIERQTPDGLSFGIQESVQHKSRQLQHKIQEEYQAEQEQDRCHCKNVEAFDPLTVDHIAENTRLCQRLFPGSQEIDHTAGDTD